MERSEKALTGLIMMDEELTPTPEETVMAEEETTKQENGRSTEVPPKKMDSFIRFLLYVFSFFMGPFGLGVILGALFFVQEDKEHQEVGRTCIILAIIPTLLVIALFFLFISFGFLLAIGRFFF